MRLGVGPGRGMNEGEVIEVTGGAGERAVGRRAGCWGSWESGGEMGNLITEEGDAR